MNDLSSNKDLSHLGRKIPFFQRREELLFALAEHKVPLIKAVWVIKLDAYHKMSQVDNTSKKVRSHLESIDLFLRCLV